MHTRSRSAALAVLRPTKGYAIVARSWAVSSPTASGILHHALLEDRWLLGGDQMSRRSLYLVETNVLVFKD